MSILENSSNILLIILFKKKLSLGFEPGIHIYLSDIDVENQAMINYYLIKKTSSLKYAGPLESDPKAENLQYEIAAELQSGIPPKLSPTMATDMNG